MDFTNDSHFTDSKLAGTTTHLIFTCSKLTMETLEKGVKYAQSK